MIPKSSGRKMSRAENICTKRLLSKIDESDFVYIFLFLYENRLMKCGLFLLFCSSVRVNVRGLQKRLYV